MRQRSEICSGGPLSGVAGSAGKGDVSDYLVDHTADELFALMQAAPLWTAPVGPIVPPMTAEIVAAMTSELLDTFKAWILRYVILSEEQATILAVWVLHTYALEAAEMTPYLHITAAEKECGKSLLMDVLAALSRKTNKIGRYDSGRVGTSC
jgi:hypothetical protein